MNHANTEKSLAAVVLHGMGSHGPGYADPLIKNVSRQLEERGKDPGGVAWAPVHWAPVTEEAQRRYLENAERAFPLGWRFLRCFAVNALGDASAYQQVDVRPGGTSTYREVHRVIQDTVRRVHRDDLKGNTPPLVVLAHSLGCHMASNYIWDIQKGRHPGVDGMSDFERFRSLAGMITFGCNIPLFTFAYKTVMPIEFPAPELPPGLREKARWLNIFNPNDVLGYPLSPIGPQYAAVVSEDIPFRAGGILARWNPWSHSKFWGDRGFAKRVADYLAGFLP